MVDGQVSVFCEYDTVISGDLLYQEYLGAVNYTYKDLLDSGKIKQPYTGAGATPELNTPNILGVFVKHDIIIPADMFNQPYKIQSWGAYSWKLKNDNNDPYKGDYSGEVARRIDGEGTGVLSGGSGNNGDIFPDIFTMGVLYAKHRIYGEVYSGSSGGQYYSRGTGYYTDHCQVTYM